MGGSALLKWLFVSPTYARPNFRSLGLLSPQVLLNGSCTLGQLPLRPEGPSVEFAGAKVWRTVDTDLEAERVFILTGK